MPRLLGVILTGCFLVLLSAGGSAFACGMPLEIPQNHFDGVNEYGVVSLWNQLGGVKLESGEAFPVYSNFRSDRESTSPTLGRGWLLPFLEASIVQLDENTFLMTDPVGRFRRLKRSAADPKLLSSKLWKAELKEEQITAWSDCGWKLVYTQGKLSSISTPKGLTLEIVSSNGIPTEVRCAGTTVLHVERDTTGLVTGLTIGAQRSLLEFERRPLVQAVGEVNLISGTAAALARVVSPNLPSKAYEYSVNDKMEPTIKFGSRLISWNPATLKVQQDGDWTYSIEMSGKAKYQTAAESRKNGKGESEYYFEDPREGLTTTVDKTGLKTVVERFTGKNPLDGKIRQETKTLGKQIVYTYRASYDELGRKIREVSTSKTSGTSETLFSFDEKGRPAQALRNGKMLWKKIYGVDGRLTEEVDEAGRKTLCSYLPDGKMVKTCVDAVGKSHAYNCQANGRALPLDIYYDALGRTSVVRDQNGDTREYSSRVSPTGVHYTQINLNGIPQFYTFLEPRTNRIVAIRFAELAGERFPYGKLGDRRLNKIDALKVLNQLLNATS